VAKQVQSEADRAAAEELANNPIAPKGHATPTRKEREAARKRPLVGGRTPEARALSKDQQRTQREKARIGLANGEEKYLPLKDRGPQKRFIRDYIDSRWGFGELAIPLLVLYFIISFIGAAYTVALEIGLYAAVALVVIDCIVATVLVRRRLAAKFGAGNVDRIGLYAATRNFQLRAMRLPKPQVKRGQYPS
jgi:hypothetical protein